MSLPCCFCFCSSPPPHPSSLLVLLLLHIVAKWRLRFKGLLCLGP